MRCVVINSWGSCWVLVVFLFRAGVSYWRKVYIIILYLIHILYIIYYYIIHIHILLLYIISYILLYTYIIYYILYYTLLFFILFFPSPLLFLFSSPLLFLSFSPSSVLSFLIHSPSLPSSSSLPSPSPNIPHHLPHSKYTCRYLDTLIYIQSSQSNNLTPHVLSWWKVSYFKIYDVWSWIVFIWLER